MRKIKSPIIAFVAMIIMCVLCGCGAGSDQQPAGTVEKAEELNGRKMGCMSGSIFDQTINKVYPDSPVIYFSSRAELLLGLKSEKIDGYLADKPVAMLFQAENPDVRYLDEAVDSVDYGICFSPESGVLMEQFNEYLDSIEQSGHKKELQEKWIRPEGLNEKIAAPEPTGNAITIKAVTTPDAAPFSFFKDNEYRGYEVELLREFCNEYGYNLQVDGTTFDALISSVASGKYDMAFNGIYITEERKKSVDFCDPTYKADVVPVVRSGTELSAAGFFTSIKTSFYRTFIEESRWKLILEGVLTTLIITVLSMVFGTAAGFMCFFVARKNRIVKKITDGFSYLITGLPAVLFLMILFYIIFAKATFSGTIIAVIGFTVIECTVVYDMLKTGTSAIDIGQYEGALALGYTDTQAFIRIILPQAVKIILPSYRKEIVTLIKGTAIVGYVTVQDLTRVSDIIRSRTYDAFFPLIVTAIIYFILAAILTFVVDKCTERLL